MCCEKPLGRNAAEAYREAGYKSRFAAQNSYHMLRRPNVRAALLQQLAVLRRAQFAIYQTIEACVVVPIVTVHEC